jgi:hypothetical protein
MLLDDCTVAYTPVGAFSGLDVVAETEDDNALSPALFTADTLKYPVSPTVHRALVK